MSAIGGVSGYPLPVLASLLSTCSCAAREHSNGHFQCFMFSTPPPPPQVLFFVVIIINIIIKHKFSYMVSFACSLFNVVTLPSCSGLPYSRVIRRPSLISAASLLGAALLLAPSYSLLGRLRDHAHCIVIGK